MPQTHAMRASAAEDVLASISHQFNVDDGDLLNITETFLREMAEGLANYGYPMAMMYAVLSSESQSLTLLPLAQPDFCHEHPRWLREGVRALLVPAL